VQSPPTIHQQDSWSIALINWSGVQMNTMNSEDAFQALNLFEIMQTNRSTGEIYRELVILDMDANVIKKKDLHNPVEFINATTILATWRGNDTTVLWNYYTDEIEYMNFTGHHEREYNAIDETFFVLTDVRREINGTSYRFDLIEEYNRTGHRVWYLDVYDFIDETQWCPYQDMIGAAADVTHGNTVYFDSDDDIIYFNARNTNTFYKIDHETGELLWSLGEYGDFTLYDKNGVERDNLFYHAHAVEPIDDDTFIIFDNDLHNQTDWNNKLSRILEITIDEVSMVANESWSWIAPAEYYCGWFGDADRLPNGNRLGTFGTRHHEMDIIEDARLVEVDSAGNIVWSIDFLENQYYEYNVYRMERFGLSPFLSTPADYNTTNSNVSISWDAWYNFRPKRTIEGHFEFFFQDIMIDSGSVFYDKFWRPVNLAFDLANLDFGTYNATLCIYDEAGHKTVDTVFILVSQAPIDYGGILGAVGLLGIAGVVIMTWVYLRRNRPEG
jgi:hypothetical protein